MPCYEKPTTSDCLAFSQPETNALEEPQARKPALAFLPLRPQEKTHA